MPLASNSPAAPWANRTRALLLARALSACAFLVAGPALGQPFACEEIKAILSQADQDFSALKGRQLKSETAADYARAHGLAPDKLGLGYLRRVHEAKKSLGAPVTACQVIDVYLEDPDSKITQSSFECKYDRDLPAARLTAAMRKQLHDCVGGEIAPDSDHESLAILLDRVASGEGTRDVSVELEFNPGDGTALAIRKTVCLRKAPDGCDD